MKNDIELLKEEFQRIKNMGLIKSLRKGPTGLGYTFECLLNKEEDQECKPDFKSIELKCKYGYTKAPLALFNYNPLRNGLPALNYIFDTYSFHRYQKADDIKIFSFKVFHNYACKEGDYTFKLKVDYLKTQVIMQAFFKGIYIEDVCAWEFKTLEKKLKVKLSTLAIIYGYPYKREGVIYYKYLKMNIYKLRGFYEFLALIQKDHLFVYFLLKEKKDKDGNIKLENHGVCFKMHQEYIPELFYKIY